MNGNLAPLARLAALLAAALAAAAPARASLGGGIDSVEADRQVLSGVRRPTVGGPRYTVQELEVGATRIREYLSASGVVFGVAWNGVAHPDLVRLLGAYAPAWRAAEARTARARGQRHRRVATPELVVERWGHMRNLQGRAYAPALLPAGVGADEIR